jgi:hypothetical protein
MPMSSMPLTQHDVAGFGRSVDLDALEALEHQHLVDARLAGPSPPGPVMTARSARGLERAARDAADADAPT